jgi:DNA polymerase III subunit beta
MNRTGRGIAMIKGSLTAKPQVFAAAVGWAAKFVTAKPVVPVHGGILLDVADGTLTVVSQSETVSTRAVLPVDGDAAGRAVVSGRLLAQIMGTMPDKPVSIEGADEHVKLSAGTFRATLPTMAEDEYPDPPAVPAPIGTVAGQAFADMVQRVAVAASTDLSNRIAMAGVHLAFADGAVTALATDSHRAAVASAPFGVLVAGTEGAALALAATLDDVAEAFLGPDDITVGLDGSNLSLTSPTRSITVRLLGEQFPTAALSGLLATEHPEHALVTVASLNGPLKRAALVRAKDGPIRLDLSEGAVTVVAKADDIAQDSDETAEVEYSGPECSLAFNPGFLTAALASAPGDVVDLAFAVAGPGERPQHAVLTVPGNDHWRHLLMPIKL